MASETIPSAGSSSFRVQPLSAEPPVRGEPLLQEIARLNEFAPAVGSNPAEVAAGIAHISRELEKAGLALDSATRIAGYALPLRDQLFALRLSVQAQIPVWHRKGWFTPPVETALRDFFRVCRYATDVAGEVATGSRRLPKNAKTWRAFDGEAINTLPGPASSLPAGAGVARVPSPAGSAPFSFRSGDVLVVRGQLHNSAAIAHIGAVDGLFSHAALVHIDEDGRQWVVESLIEWGAVINTLDSLLEHNLARAAVFRHPDGALAARASKLMYERVRRSRTRGGKRILYDFSGNIDGYSKLYCSKVVREAYDEASGGALKLPAYPTQFDSRSRDFLDRIGITSSSMFAPSDMDLEPDFLLAAEWQDYRATASIRLQDLVMVKLFEWMEAGGYTFREDFLVWLISVFGRAASHLPESIKKALENSVPPIAVNMARRTIALVAMLHWTAEPLFQSLQKLEAERLKKTGLPLHPKDALAALEEMRQKRKGRRLGYLYP